MRRRKARPGLESPGLITLPRSDCVCVQGSSGGGWHRPRAGRRSLLPQATLKPQSIHRYQDLSDSHGTNTYSRIWNGSSLIMVESLIYIVTYAGPIHSLSTLTVHLSVPQPHKLMWLHFNSCITKVDHVATPKILGFYRAAHEPVSAYPLRIVREVAQAKNR
jgi:hypothetical protein